MKPQMRTSRWLAMARRNAGLSQVELVKLAGLRSTIILSLFETGSQLPTDRVWDALENALRPLVPLMFVDEDALISVVEAGARWDGGDALCRLGYVASRHGVAFTDVRPVDGEQPGDFFITVPLTEALRLLQVQKTWIGESPDCSEDVVEDQAGSREGEELRRMRKALSLDQRSVARMLSASQPAISLLERGLENPPDLIRRYRELLERLTEEAQVK